MEMAFYATLNLGMVKFMLLPLRIAPSAKFLCAALFAFSLHARAADMKVDEQGALVVSPAVAALIEQAEAGDADAANTLGTQFGNGLSVVQNDAEALKWYKKAAELGSVEAEYNLGWVHQNGLGTPVDYKEAMKWYRKAAEHGDFNAANTLGALYEQGEGVPRDLDEAMKWYEKAVQLGHPSAHQNLQRLQQQKSP